MPGNRSTDFKPETYTRLTHLTKTRFLHLKNTLNTYVTRDTPLSCTDIKTLTHLQSEIQRKYDDFNINVDRVVQLLSDNDTISDDILATDQNTVSDLYIELTSDIEGLLSTTEQSNQHSLDVSSTTHESCSARLPKLELPKFNGSFADWSNFINVFNTAIHQNNALNKITKFQYLLSVLSSEPLHLIKNLPLTESNYDIAYQLIFKRYQNDRRLRLMHLNTILDLPDISSRNIPHIRDFVNHYNEHVQALSAIDCDITNSNHLLSALLLRKLDVDLRKRLEVVRDNKNATEHTLPDAAEIIEFLTSECDRHEDAVSSVTVRTKDLQKSHVNEKHLHFNARHQTARPVFSATSKPQQPAISCAGCDRQDHKTYACNDFLQKSPQERFQAVKLHHHCICCLGNHNVRTCSSQSVCKICSKRHNTLLHFNNETTPSCNRVVQSTTSKLSSSQLRSSTKDSDSKNTIALHVRNPQPKTSKSVMVLLGTLLVNIRCSVGRVLTFRAIIDTGSMASLISERAVHLLNAPRERCSTPIVGISQRTTQTRGQITASIETLSGTLLQENHHFIILNKLTPDLPRCSVASEVVSMLHQEQLADPSFHTPSRIDLILGASLVPHLFTGTITSLGDTLPSLIETPCGNVVIGTTPCVTSKTHLSTPQTSTLNVCLFATDIDDIHESIQRFWTQEEVKNHSQKSQEDDRCEQSYVNTHTRDESGRYIVRLPFKGGSQILGSSKDAARQRLLAMERKFSKNQEFATLYKEFMQEFTSLNHMSPINTPSPHSEHYYLPHHGVLRESSSSTKLRTVFDASCKTSSGYSLNDLLLTGPSLLTNIADVLTQFRRHHIVMCCDIKQMYRQIMIHPDDCKYQLVLWRNSPDQPMQSFQLNTVTYGVNCSPYLAIRTLHQLAIDEGHQYPLAAYALKHHTYVDDIITGSDTLETAIQLKDQLTQLLQLGQFELRKWISNSDQLLQQIPETYRETPKFVSDLACQQFTVLGLHWLPSQDVFTYTTTPLHCISNFTKRTVLSAIAKIYDPCGFLTPCILIAKCIMQQIWTTGIGWDSILPATLTNQWLRFTDDLKHLSEIRIPRSLNLISVKNVELHGFADASEIGYACIIYFRCLHFDDTITVSLVMAKSRVAPLRRMTIPRLELCAAHLLTRLTTHCIALFPNIFNTNNIFLWTDSTIVLSWIKSPAYKLKTFVANRVAEIQEFQSNEIWRHVNSSDNPADCGSRGLRIKQLLNHNLWWSGPTWLSRPSMYWPDQNYSVNDMNISSELKPVPLPVFITTPSNEWQPLQFYSSWTKLTRVIALVCRFVYNCKNKENQRKGFITTDEMRSATRKIFYAVQSEVFNTERQELKANNCPNHLNKLHPFIDDQDIIRVGGRLQNSQLSYNMKHPILMPKCHHVTNIYIDYWHVAYLHAGPLLVQSMLSRSVWILNARNIIRKRIHNCITCFKHNPKNSAPLMAPLPSFRVTPAKPFLHTGTDFIGPFLTKLTHMRFVKTTKTYVCLFICMATKAVHLELVTDLSTEAFIAALTRFIARRGICSHLYSDCGTNFKGACNELNRITHHTITSPKARQEIELHFSPSSIQFHFNPPAAPNFGGLWERAVQSVKRHLIRIVGTTVLTFPEMTTLLTQIEAVINSRPITPLSTDPREYDVLTPGHFLTGAPLVSIPEPCLLDTSSNRLSRWQQVQQFSQQLWKRWSLEYLHNLQQRHRWTKDTTNIKIGDLVLLRTSMPPCYWPTGRIIKVFPGKDDVIRVVRIKTTDGEYTRPLTQLYPLPLQDNSG